MTAERPIAGEPIPNGWHERLYNDVKAMECHGDGENIAVSRTADGQVIRLIGEKGQGAGGKNATAAVELMQLRSVPSGGYGQGLAQRVTIAADGTVTPIAGATVTVILPNLN